MCFSAEASFAGGVIICAVGVVTVREVHKPSQIIFACIPLFFGFQQIVEGSLWLSLPDADYFVFSKICTYLYLIMAQILWPVIIPISVLLMEKDSKKRRILRILLLTGIILSLYYSFCLITFHVTPQIINYHIQYNTTFPEALSMPALLVYLISTITPLFISGLKRTRLLGILMTLSFIVTAIFFTQYLASVWCFFAALISGVIFWILSDSKKRYQFGRLYSSVISPEVKLHN